MKKRNIALAGIVFLVAAVVGYSALYEEAHITKLRIGTSAYPVSGSSSSVLEKLYNGTVNVTLVSNATAKVYGSNYVIVTGGSFVNGGTETITGKTTANGELEANADVDINFGIATEEMTIDQTNAAGTADVPLIAITDARTGATANTAGEATLVITASGTHALNIASGIANVQAVTATSLDASGEVESGSLDVNATAATDYVRIDQTNATGTSTQPLVSITDARTGANANSAAEATLVITPSGTHAISVVSGITAVQAAECTTLTASSTVDADSYTADAGYGIDVQSSGALKVGTTTATSVDYGSSAVTAHTFTSDGTGTAEVVLPAGSIDSAEVLNGTLADEDLSDTSALTFGGAACTQTNGTFTGKASDSLVIGSTDATFTATRNDSGAVTITAADNDANAALTVAAGGTGALTLGASGNTSVTVTTDGSGDAEVVLPTGAISSGEITDSSLVVGDMSIAGVCGKAGVTATAAAGSAVNYIGAVHYDVFTFTNVVHTATDGSDEGESKELMTFPEGRILILGAAINAVVTCNTNFEASTNDTFDQGIGTAAANDAADLTGTEVDIIASTTFDTVSGTDQSHDWEADMTSGADTVFDGTSSAVKLYSNLGIANTSILAGLNVVVTNSGTLQVVWAFLGDD